MTGYFADNMSIMTNPEQNVTWPQWVWWIYLVLFALSIPWYLPNKMAMTSCLGLPLWLICCIAIIFLTAIYTVVVIHLFWTESDHSDQNKAGAGIN